MALPVRLFGFQLARTLGGLISAVQFPTQLKPGDPITGKITITNSGTADIKGTVTVTPTWLTGVTYTSVVKTVPAGQSVDFLFPSEFTPTESLLMPKQNATLNIGATFDTQTDSTTFTIKLSWLYMQIGPFPLYYYIIGGIGLVILLMLVAPKKK
jgi:uncharacterized protein YfaS (alpha-2-macroglobulin family)